MRESSSLSIRILILFGFYGEVVIILFCQIRVTGSIPVITVGRRPLVGVFSPMLMESLDSLSDNNLLNIVF